MFPLTEALYLLEQENLIPFIFVWKGLVYISTAAGPDTCSAPDHSDECRSELESVAEQSATGVAIFTLTNWNEISRLGVVPMLLDTKKNTNRRPL